MINFGFGIELGTIYDSILPMTREWRNSFEIWKWCRQNDLISKENHQKWFDSLRDRNDIKMYSIFDGTKTVGICGFTDIDRMNLRAEFSLYIAPEYQRMGYSKPALGTLFCHGFMNHNFNVIWGETFADNFAFKIFMAMGMKHEGTRRQFYFKHGKYIDAHLVSMTRAEYEEEAPWKSAQR